MVEPRFPAQPDFIGRLLRDLWTAYVAETAALLQSGHPGVTQSQTRVMTLVDRAGTRPSELARRAAMTRQSMNEALAGLRAAGLVAINDDPAHGRAKLVVLTRAGDEALRDGLDAALTVHERWGALLGERKMEQLLKLLRQLADAVGSS